MTPTKKTGNLTTSQNRHFLIKWHPFLYFFWAPWGPGPHGAWALPSQSIAWKSMASIHHNFCILEAWVGGGLVGRRRGTHQNNRLFGAQQKCIKKEAILSNNDDFGRLSSFPEIFCLGSFFGKLIDLIAPEMAPWLQKKSEDQSGGPRTNLEIFGDEASFQYFPKT